MLTIADTPDALTPEWLTAALTASGTLSGARVVAADVRPLGTGQMCDSVRIHLRYDAPYAGPASLVAKLPAADEGSRATAIAFRSYEKEVRFYQELADRLPVRTPRLHYADLDVATASFVLLLEDLAPAEPGDQLQGCGTDVAAAAVAELVNLHAPLWGDPALRQLDWLHGDPEGRGALLREVLPMLWAGFQERYAASLEPHVKQAGDLYFGAMAFGRLGSRHQDDRPVTVTHVDYRLDNLLIDPDGVVTVVDWQTCGTGNGPSDVAYFLGAGLAPEVRREAEVRLVRGYHDGLVAAGVTGYDWADCWLDYRRGTWSGLSMAVLASMSVKRTDRGDAMFLAMAERHARHALDLDAADLLT
ncbi:phosphotransferase family protein [Blastococcus goldschmidtiae]|uniref:Aminoglycoside phosphotransferase family protein n=1 Tax=Blastococcus goldschmidtiae TaxID=3075546 RepID=A0ABU2K5I1_9ACTN|nr:aminoglycoside phosphotransferase family protein [Blastococcus sp. DSM 46792]MDT0275455.1 aminoglycoside phosphotransferase family protein [Blastococcus sp. DSM 46792]